VRAQQKGRQWLSYGHSVKHSIFFFFFAQLHATKGGNILGRPGGGTQIPPLTEITKFKRKSQPFI
jgi:hypothetical protein